MSDEKLVNIARLMTTYNFEIEQFPDNLKCVQCGLVLKDACQVPCGCRLCRFCVNDMMARGRIFCPGVSKDCGESLLARFVSDYLANKKVMNLSVKCSYDGCMYECQLVNMEEHLRECLKKIEKCPFCELGCTQDKLATEEMGGHLHHENRRHSEILVGMIANINREIETLKQIDKTSRKEIETLKYDLVLKDRQIRSIMNRMIYLQNENELIKNDIKSIKEEKEDLAGRVRILSEDIDREIVERNDSDELVSARVINHVDKEIAAITWLIGSNKDEFVINIQSMRDDITSINQGFQSIKEDICSVKALVGLGQVDASILWLIEVDLDKTSWYCGYKLSEYFFGEVHPYKYRLESYNFEINTALAELRIRLVIEAGPNDGQLTWPFEARVVITVTDRDRRETCVSISQQCEIDRPPDNDCRWSDRFKFLHSELRGAGLNLSRGVNVSCVIVPGGDG